MIKINDIKYRIGKTCTKTASLMLIIVLVLIAACPGQIYAVEEIKDPIREVHRVRVDDLFLCCFVQNNVVLTTAEISKMTDSELTKAVVRRAGVYFRLTNCRKPSHHAVTYKAWIKAGRSFMLREEDIEKIRSASPSEGEPVKLYMDLGISKDPEPEEKPDDPKKEDADDDQGDKPSDDPSDDPGDDTGDDPSDDPGGDTGSDTGDDPSDDPGDDPAEDPDDPGDDPEPEPKREVYWTRKLLSPHLLYVVIATETDSQAGEDNCTIKPVDPDDPDDPDIDDDDKEKKEKLPEFRTISMIDRSGGPLDPVLEDGEEVHLEWIEPGTNPDIDDNVFSIEDFSPGGTVGFILITGSALAAVIFAAIMIRKKLRQRKQYRA